MKNKQKSPYQPKYTGIKPIQPEEYKNICCNLQYRNVPINFVYDYGGYGGDENRRYLRVYQCTLCKNYHIEIGCDEWKIAFKDIIIINNLEDIEIIYSEHKSYIIEIKCKRNNKPVDICLKQGFDLSKSFDNMSTWNIINEALHTDGAHHKQWYLEQLAIRLGFNINHEYLIQLQDEEYGTWDKGIAP